jgi:hypothetical protein
MGQRLRRGCAIAALACALTGCGASDGKRVSQELARQSIAPAVQALPSALISTRELAAAPAGSPMRAFLSMWSDLQWQSWPSALSYYQPGLVHYIGTSAMLDAFEFDGALFRTSKPKIDGESQFGATRVTIRYVLSSATPAASAPVPNSITWSQIGGQWEVAYYPELDGILASWAQTQAQQQIDPTAVTPSPGALAAGIRIEGAQSRYFATQGSGG